MSSVVEEGRMRQLADGGKEVRSVRANSFQSAVASRCQASTSASSAWWEVKGHWHRREVGGTKSKCKD